jgi:hypothetical protein
MPHHSRHLHTLDAFARMSACDQKLTEDTVFKLFAAVSGACTAAGVELGHRLGLYKTVAMAGPATSSAIAVAHGGDLSERFLREWLQAQACAGMISTDAAAGTFWLNNGQRAVLADDRCNAQAPRMPPLLVRFDCAIAARPSSALRAVPFSARSSSPSSRRQRPSSAGADSRMTTTAPLARTRSASFSARGIGTCWFPASSR